MRNALYFPFISIPETPWLIQTLLYWDRVGSIVPREFADNPEKLQPHMRQLLSYGLVNLINPMEYTWRIERFEDDFIQLLDLIPHGTSSTLRPLQSARKLGFQQVHQDKLSNSVLKRYYKEIHAEKLSTLLEELIERKLAIKGEDNWYYIEKQIAGYFMTYLAVGISSVANYQPITDRYGGLSAFGGGTFGFYPPNRSRLRARVLEDILPAPTMIEDFREILEFKEKYNDELKRFRKRIERFLGSIEELPFREANEKIEGFIEDVSEEKDELARRMGENGLPKVTFETICTVGSIGSSIADGVMNSNPYSLASGAFGVAQFWEKLKNQFRNNRSHSMAYAVYAQRKSYRLPN
ncbi:hypothetical protein AXX12_17150 [Anaerosporomusa subterranea]|uniref:Uncharacterized protein n=1 Tax=Anaerosporomusa subterranea TaxID=1794912 RepID=A0A154BV31_ANASB|nr:hypothetical protein [Anaerosporomusa subterranea]KYZ77792.1 hypothetical protein AXX12_17150 [Anaerosporomusa subterranea]